MRRSRSKCALSAPRFGGALPRGAVRHFETGAAALPEGAKAAEQKAPLQAFFPSFSKSRLFFLQTFPRKALAVLWDFKGLQGL